MAGGSVDPSGHSRQRQRARADRSIELLSPFKMGSGMHRQLKNDSFIFSHAPAHERHRGAGPGIGLVDSMVSIDFRWNTRLKEG